MGKTKKQRSSQSVAIQLNWTKKMIRTQNPDQKKKKNRKQNPDQKKKQRKSRLVFLGEDRSFSFWKKKNPEIMFILQKMPRGEYKGQNRKPVRKGKKEKKYICIYVDFIAWEKYAATARRSAPKHTRTRVEFSDDFISIFF